MQATNAAALILGYAMKSSREEDFAKVILFGLTTAAVILWTWSRVV